VIGAAIHSTGICSSDAPSVWKMRLTSAVCSAKPNWMPRNPKHMFHICQNDSSGFAFMRGRFRLPWEGETRAIMNANDARRMLYGNMAGAGHSAIGTCAAPW
jgi:hypothetical protein